MTNPCKNCQDRAMGCHAKCDRYKAWRAERDPAVADLRKFADSDSYRIENMLARKRKATR